MAVIIEESKEKKGTTGSIKMSEYFGTQKEVVSWMKKQKFK